MRTLDWLVMFGWLISLVCFGLYRGRGSTTTRTEVVKGDEDRILVEAELLVVRETGWKRWIDKVKGQEPVQRVAVTGHRKK